MFSSISSRIAQRINVLRWAPRSWVKRQVVDSSTPLCAFGTSYSRGSVLDNGAVRGSTAVLCGAGEDISFDLECQRRLGCRLKIVDPTPRAIEHVNDVLEAARQGLSSKSYVINGIPLTYDLTGIAVDEIELIPFGVWNESTTLRFFAPKDPAHVSYSITNLQGTTEAIEMPVKTLADIEPGPIGLLKLNIEGAEIEVLMWLIESAIRPVQVLVVFDELHTPNADSSERIKKAVIGLQRIGYSLIHYDGFGSCLFVHGPSA